MTETLQQARERREAEAASRAIDAWIEQRLEQVSLAAPISPQAKFKLRYILRKYAKDPHPFRACVRDNAKRFGPGRVEAVCATLKDTIKGNKNWRKGGGHKLAEEDEVQLDGETLAALNAISDVDLEQIFLEARALEEHGTASAVSLLGISGADELKRWGTDGEIGLKLAEARK